MGEGWKLVLSYLGCQRDERIVPDLPEKSGSYYTNHNFARKAAK